MDTVDNLVDNPRRQINGQPEWTCRFPNNGPSGQPTVDNPSGMMDRVDNRVDNPRRQINGQPEWTN
jgi:hypothetical protein